MPPREEKNSLASMRDVGVVDEKDLKEGERRRAGEMEDAQDADEDEGVAQ